MLVEVVIGDAYGAGFEYADAVIVCQRNDLSGYFRRHRAVTEGRYTDDTQMSVAIAELIVSDAAWTRENIADKFVEAFKRDPRKGYAGSFYNFLCEVEDGTEFLERIRPYSDKSGAAMRSTPIGLFPDARDVLKRSRLQATLTHDTPDGIHAAQAAALAAHYCAYGLGPKSDLTRFIEDYVPGPWSASWVGPVGPKGWMSVRAALTALTATDRLSDLLRACVEFTGDVDTVAAIALGAGSLSQEFDRDLPRVLVDHLEDGPYGRRYLEQLDQRLAARFGLPRVATTEGAEP